MKKRTTKKIAGTTIYAVIILAVFLFPLSDNPDKIEPYTVNRFAGITESGNKPIIIKDINLQEKSVYITATGTKYHKYGCRYLHSSCIKLTFERAKSNGYEPCKICN